MNVVYTFDDGYSAITAVSMLSLLENNKSENELMLYIVDCGIKESNKNKFIALAQKYSRPINFIEAKNMEEKIPIKLDVSYWSFVCYVRLFFSELLPDIDKVIHIDCDTIVRGNLSDIYNSDLNGNLCAACYDCVPSPKFAARFPKESQYFSNGLLIFDLKAMRQDNTQQKFIDYIVAKGGDLPHLDQDVVNGVLSEKIKVLPPEYNVMTYTALFKEKACRLFDTEEPYYTPDQIKNAVKDPVMVHLVGYRFVSRPWGQPCYHPYNNEWIEYYRNIEFDDNLKLLNKKKKKYGFVRELICLLWNIGYKIPCIRSFEFEIEKKRINKQRDKYGY